MRYIDDALADIDLDGGDLQGNILKRVMMNEAYSEITLGGLVFDSAQNAKCKERIDFF